MIEPWTVELKGAEQGAKRPAAVGLQLKRRATVWARCMGVEKGGELLLEEVALEGTQELFGFGQTQPEMLNVLVVRVEGDEIGDGLFPTIIVTDDELQFDAHRRASPDSSDR